MPHKTSYLFSSTHDSNIIYMLNNIYLQIAARMDTINHTTLRINNTRIQDGGSYSCLLAHSNTFDKLYFTLNVMNVTLSTAETIAPSVEHESVTHAKESGTLQSIQRQFLIVLSTMWIIILIYYSENQIANHEVVGADYWIWYWFMRSKQPVK